MSETIHSAPNGEPAIHSPYESYSLLRESIDAAHDDSLSVEVFTDRYWQSVKKGDADAQLETLSAVYQNAIGAVCCYIQTAKLALKAIEALKGDR